MSENEKKIPHTIPQLNIGMGVIGGGVNYIDNVVRFAFRPKQWVTVTMHDMNYPARVIRCIQEHGDRLYDCDLWVNGEARRREFYEDEITAKARNS